MDPVTEHESNPSEAPQPERSVEQTDQWAQWAPPRYPPPPYPYAADSGQGWQGGGMWGPPPPPPPGMPSTTRPGPGRRGLAAIVVVALLAGVIGALAGTAISHRHRVLTPFTNSNVPSVDGNGSNGVSPDVANAVAAKVDPAVVDVTSNLGYQNAVAAGTGIVLTPTGEVLTNNHVINGATKITVKIDGRGPSYPATVLGTDPTDDVALLQMQGASGLKTATTANSSKLSVGDKVIAIGNALGQQGTPAVTSGAITALNQTITATDEGAASSETLSGLIQTDAPLQRGDSGGPLVNTTGQVIGMNTAASGRTPFGSISNQAFAIPINKALSVANQIRAGKSSSTVHLGQRPFLGVEVQSNNSGVGGSSPSTSGAVIAGVANNTPAATAGLQSGDVITQFDGKTIDSASALTSAIGTHHPSDSVTVGWVDQAGQHHTATVKLAAGPAD